MKRLFVVVLALAVLPACSLTVSGTMSVLKKDPAPVASPSPSPSPAADAAKE